MTPTIIKPKDDHLPSFVLPDYNNVQESFAPFWRLPEPQNSYETSKRIFVTIFILPIRVIILISGLIFFTSWAILGSIGYDPASFEQLTSTIPLWRRFCFAIARFSGQTGLYVYGFHNCNISFKHYSYKEMEQLFNYKPPIAVQHDKDGNEIHPRCHVIASNHTGFADILALFYYFKGAFVSKSAIRDVFGVGRIAVALHTFFMQKGKSTAKILKDRIQFDVDYHTRIDCKECSLCTSNLVIFPEGTTTNGNDLVMFRRGVFNCGLPVRPIIIKYPWISVNPCWETIFFRDVSWKCMTQFCNNMEIYVGPPYIPTEEEKRDSLLYAYNMNILMAQMIGLNNEGKKAKIYLINRDVKVNCFHKKYVSNWDDDAVLKSSKERIKNDILIDRYLTLIKNDNRYSYNGEETDDEQSETSTEPKT